VDSALLDRRLDISCQPQEGLEKVIGKIEALIQTPVGGGGEDTVLTSVRHQQEVQKAHRALESLQSLMKTKQPHELWAEELREAALAIGRIRGRNLPATAFEEIFTKFCIGK
jgi:tRNA U34 5-carboxymethylaminomethyl modifying GTPase MnmE/TrmE